MKKQFTLSVANPCSENWDNFKPTLTGGFCHSCSKNVVDFTKMSEKEIIEFFRKRPTHTCGRFHPDQLKTYSLKTAPLIIPGLKLLQGGILSLFLILASKNTFAKNTSIKASTEVVQSKEQQEEKSRAILNAGHIIKGVVTDEFNEPIPGANIYLRGSDIGTITDINGKFRFPKELKGGDVLIFSFIGFETKEYVVPKEAPEILELQLEMYMQLMGEVQIEGPYKAK